MDEGLKMLIAAALGGIGTEGLRLIGQVYSSRLGAKDKRVEAQARRESEIEAESDKLRKEWREEVYLLRAEIKKLDGEVDQYRLERIKLMEDNLSTRTQLLLTTTLLEKTQRELEETKVKLAAALAELAELRAKNGM